MKRAAIALLLTLGCEVQEQKWGVVEAPRVEYSQAKKCVDGVLSRAEEDGIVDFLAAKRGVVGPKVVRVKSSDDTFGDDLQRALCNEYPRVVFFRMRDTEHVLVSLDKDHWYMECVVGRASHTLELRRVFTTRLEPCQVDCPPPPPPPCR